MAHNGDYIPPYDGIHAPWEFCFVDEYRIAVSYRLVASEEIEVKLSDIPALELKAYLAEWDD